MTTSIDRRKFLTYTGAAGAATGALWVAPSVLGSSSAFAAGSCEETHQINWVDYVGGAFASTGGSQSFTLTPTIYGTNQSTPYDITMTVTQVGVFNSPQAQVDTNNFGLLNNTYRLWMEGTSPASFGWDITFTWPSTDQAYHLNLTLTVIDENTASPGYRDIVYLTPEHFTGGQRDPDYVAGNGKSATPWQGKNGVVTGSSINGNIGTSDTQSGPLGSVTISYRGDPTLYGAMQSIGINNLSWCP